MDRQSVAAASADDLEDELTCPVCLDLFVDPVVLPCSHSLCRECLRRTLTSVGRRCPQCRAELAVGSSVGEVNKLVSGLPRNLALAAFVGRFRDDQQRRSRARERQVKQAELLKQKQQQQPLLRRSQGDDDCANLMCEMCRADNESRLAELYCPQCEVAYCQDCLRRYHPALGPLRRHAVVQLAGEADVLRKLRRSLRHRRGQSTPPLPTFLKTSAAVGLSHRASRLCQRHPPNQIRLHCSTCNIGVCTDCLVASPSVAGADDSASGSSSSTHAGHALITLTAAAEARLAKRRDLGEKAAALALEVDREAAATRRARDRLRATLTDARRGLELQSRQAAMDLVAAVRAVRADAEERAAALDDATEAAARLDRQLAAQNRLSSRLARVSRQLLQQTSPTPALSVGDSPDVVANRPTPDDLDDADEAAYLAGQRQVDRCSAKARALADAGAGLRVGLEARTAEARQLPAEFCDRLRRHLADAWLLPARTAGDKDKDESTRDQIVRRRPHTDAVRPVSDIVDASSVTKQSAAVTKSANPTRSSSCSAENSASTPPPPPPLPREASTWGFATAVFSPDCVISNGASWTILIGLASPAAHQSQPTLSDILVSTGVSERRLSTGSSSSSASSAAQQRLLLGDVGYGLIVTNKCVAFVSPSRLADCPGQQRPVCRLPLSSSSSNSSGFPLRLRLRLSLPPRGPASLAYEIAEAGDDSTAAPVCGVEPLTTRCSSLYPVLCVTSRVRVQVLEQPAAVKP